MTLTAEEYRTLLETQRQLVVAGVHAAVAGQMVMRALERVGAGADAGVGRKWQERRIRREEPGVAPRPVQPGEQCVMIREIPGREEELWRDLKVYEQRGFNVMEVEAGGGDPKRKTFWACPPGQMPREMQPQVLQAEPYGGPLDEERF